MKLEEITKKNSADNDNTLIENTDLVDNERYIMNKATGQTNNNIECTQIENNTSNGQSNQNRINTSGNNCSRSNFYAANVNKCANCFRQNHSDQHLRYKIRFHSIKSSKIRHQGTFKFIKKRSGTRECDYTLCDECKDYLVEKKKRQ